MIVGLYERWIFRGSRRLWHGTKVEYLGSWEGSHKDFLHTFHLLYPNDEIQIYLHRYKPLSRELKVRILEFMKTDLEFLSERRNETLNNLLS